MKRIVNYYIIIDTNYDDAYALVSVLKEQRDIFKLKIINWKIVRVILSNFGRKFQLKQPLSTLHKYTQSDFFLARFFYTKIKQSISHKIK